MGLVGGGLSVVLVAAAVVLVAGDEGPPGLFWDPALVVTAGSAEALGSPPSSARDQLLLTLELEGVSGTLEAGQTTSFGLRLVNGTEEAISLDPCPSYRVSYTGTDVANPRALTPTLGATPLVEMRGRFRCDDSSELGPGDRAEVEVFFDIDPRGFTGPTTIGAIEVELWPDAPEPHPRARAFGVVVDRGGGRVPIELPPGLEGIDGIEGVEGFQGVEGGADLEDP